MPQMYKPLPTTREERGEAIAEKDGQIRRISDKVYKKIAVKSTNGVLGDPDGASAAEGAALLGRLFADLLAAVDAWEARQAS